MPYIQEFRTDPLLSEISVQYTNPTFAAEILFPRVSVAKSSAKYNVYGREVFRRNVTSRASTGDITRATYSVAQKTFTCKEKALYDLIDDNVRDESGEGARLDETTTVFLTQQILLDIEMDVATKATAAANYNSSNTVTLTGTDQWSDEGNSNPIDDINDGQDAILKQIGVLPNVMLLGPTAFKQLRKHPDIVNQLKYHESRLARAADIAEIFEIETVAVARAVYNSAKQGATEVMGFIWGDDVILAWVPLVPAINMPAYGYTFVKGTRETFVWREAKAKSDAIGVADIVTSEFICQDSSNDSIAGYLIKDVAA